MPRYDPIPDDGPVGELLAGTGRHPNRPAHAHAIVTAPGHRPVTTPVSADDPARAVQVGLPSPCRTVHFDVSLRPIGSGP